MRRLEGGFTEDAERGRVEERRNWQMLCLLEGRERKVDMVVEGDFRKYSLYVSPLSCFFCSICTSSLYFLEH